MKKIKKGFTLTEVLLTLGVAAIIIIVIFLALPKVLSSYKSSQDIRNLTSLQNSIRELYRGQSNYNGLSVDFLLKAKMIPEDMIAAPGQTSTDILTAYSGKVYFGAVSSGFTISFTNVPPDACIKIVTAVAPLYRQITANGANVKAYYSVPEMDITNVTTQCSTTQNNYLIFYST